MDLNAADMVARIAADSYVLDPATIRDITPDVLDLVARIQVLPAAYWAGTTPQERALFGHRNGIYSFPTVELVDHLRALIDGRYAVEIGAGHGILAEALGIPAVDNKMQDWPRYRAIYEAAGQPTVPYGPNVQQMDAAQAVRRLQPAVVIGCWVTHKWDRRNPQLGGNEVGIDQMDILANCAVYVEIGNEKVHRQNPLWKLPHAIGYPEFVYSRARAGRDYIAIWPGAKAGAGRKAP